MTTKTWQVKQGQTRALAAGLHIVATPIGNLRDITLRALDALAMADVIACEDSRVTARLLTAYGIDTPRTPYHEHNAQSARPKLIARMKAGEAVALVTDAGTPLISDPGYKLALEARDEGIAVTTLPGPSAPVTALVLSGLPSDSFFFAGFAPPRQGARRQAIAAVADVPGTLVFFESAKRLAAFLKDALTVLGPRTAAVTRELTKMHEEIARGTLAELAERYARDGAPRGEVVVVIGAATAEAEGDALARLDDALDAALAAGGSLRDAVDRVAAETGLARRKVYARALARNGGQP